MTDETISIYKGDNATLVVTVTESNTWVNITGFTFKFTVKYDPTEPDANAEFTKSTDLASEISLTTPAQGELEIYIDPANTISMMADRYCYDVEMTTDGGDVYTIVRDFLVVEEDVSKG